MTVSRCWAALETRASLLRLWNQPERLVFLLLNDPGESPDILDEPDPATTNALRTALKEAVPFWVDRDMTALVDSAWESMPAEALRPADLLEPSGFAVFDEPFVVWHDDGTPWAYDAACWLATERAVCVAMYNNAMIPSAPAEWWIFEMEPWPWGWTVAQVEERSRDRHHAGTPDHYPELRWLKAFWALSGQRVAVRTSVGAFPRPVQRRLSRADIPANEVNLITLRRPDNRPATRRTTRSNGRTDGWSAGTGATNGSRRRTVTDCST